MPKLLMPKATALWLIENTKLTFEQIAVFCNMHPVEIQVLADGDIGGSLQALNPVINHQLTAAEIARCEEDSTTQLKFNATDLPEFTDHVGRKRPVYTPIAKRADKPDAIAWCLSNHPELTDNQICKLIGTTKNTIVQIRSRTHWNIKNLQPRSPAELGLCSFELQYQLIDKAKAAQVKAKQQQSNSDTASPEGAVEQSAKQ